ncbi:MAG: hypothetical protein HY272_09425 [Gammaproteobacteria bacterium]|nr:hypothetical protein [Gammaproteobacteria bacterium]
MNEFVLPIHFGNFQGKHEINTNSLLVFIESYKEITEVFGLAIDIQIGTPEEGGWKTNLFFLISFIGASPFITLLTGETADDWAKKGHAEIVRAVNEFVTRRAADIPEKFPRECIKQKNKIYHQFQKDNCIDTFRLGDFAPIPRNNFHLYIKEVPDEELLYLGETNIIVHSPDWKGKRSWRGKIEIVEDNQNAFDFDKDLTGKFWEKVKLDALPLHTTDVMRVQIVKRPTNKVKYLVIRVLSYNDAEIDVPLSSSELSGFTVSSGLVGKRPAQGDLFGGVIQ